MRRVWIGVVLGCFASVLLPGPAHAAAKPPPKLNLAISNFRFCPSAPCTPLDAGYLRTNSGPVSGTDNPLATIDVKRGTTVVWTYMDSTCDAINGCPGHNIWFENGGVGVKKGAVPSNKGPKTITVKINEKPGTTIRYFCTVNGHYMIGMTGILHVT
jgi:plastocyanin